MKNKYLIKNCDESPIKPGKDAILFCHSSYEMRSLAIKKKNMIAGDIKYVFIIHSENFKSSPLYRNNHQELIAYFKSTCNAIIIELAASKDSALSFIDRTEIQLGEYINNSKEIIVDISTFPRERMILLLDFIKRVAPNKNIHVVYCEPKEYASEINDEAKSWLSQGVRRIAPIPGFNGRQHTQKGCLLVIQLGHEGERALMTIKKIEPDKLILVGQSQDQYKEGIDKIFKKQSQSIINEFAHKIEKIYLLPAHDCQASYNILWRIYELFNKKYNISANLNGTKLQVIGAMRYCQENRNIELVYSDPQFYNYTAYSKGIGHCMNMNI